MNLIEETVSIGFYNRNFLISSNKSSHKKQTKEVLRFSRNNIKYLRNKEKSMVESLELIKLLVWPITVLIVLFIFKKPISIFIEKANKGNLKIGNVIEIAVEATGHMIQSSLEKVVSVNELDRPRYIEDSVKRINETILKFQNNFEKIRNKKILWIDDHPKRNLNEKLTFETMGIRVILSMTNDEALNKIKKENFDLIISDLFSDEGLPKGFELLEKLKINDKKIPLIFYTGRVTQDIEEKAEKNGAFGIVDIPAALISKALSALILMKT